MWLRDYPYSSVLSWVVIVGSGEWRCTRTWFNFILTWRKEKMTTGMTSHPYENRGWLRTLFLFFVATNSWYPRGRNLPSQGAIRGFACDEKPRFRGVCTAEGCRIVISSTSMGRSEPQVKWNPHSGTANESTTNFENVTSRVADYFL